MVDRLRLLPKIGDDRPPFLYPTVINGQLNRDARYNASLHRRKI